MQPDLVKVATDAGFPHPENIIMMFIGGSHLHGVKLDGTDDMDVYGVFLERPESIIGLDKMEHFVTSTAKQGDKNGPNDTDIIMYSLRKWIRLAISGNPTALQFLFATPAFNTPVWNLIAWERHRMISADHAKKYLGYARSQLDRLLGIRGQKNVKRPELEGIHGYDTKYASCVVRILVEGVELITTGRISFPCIQHDLLLKIRKGELPLATVVGLAEYHIRELEKAHLDAIKCNRFEPIDRQFISRLLVKTYLEHWLDVPITFSPSHLSS